MVRETIEKIHSMSIDEIEKEKERIRKEQDEISDKIYNCHVTGNIESLSDYIEKYDELCDLYDLYCFVPNSRMIGENENITLWKREWNDEDPLAGTYIIRDKQNINVVGDISFNPKLRDGYFGSIAYNVYNRYNGHSYAFQALCLLSNYLRANGVDRITVNALKDNIASVKTIYKFRDYLQGGDFNEENGSVLFSSFDLSLLDEKTL